MPLIVSLPTVTVTSGTAAAGSPSWDISDAGSIALLSGGSTTVNMEVAFSSDTGATFTPLLAPWRSYSTATPTAVLVTTSGAFTFEGIVAKQVRFISSGTVAAAFTITGVKTIL